MTTMNNTKAAKKYLKKNQQNCNKKYNKNLLKQRNKRTKLKKKTGKALAVRSINK